MIDQRCVISPNRVVWYISRYFYRCFEHRMYKTHGAAVETDRFVRIGIFCAIFEISLNRAVDFCQLYSDLVWPSCQNIYFEENVRTIYLTYKFIVQYGFFGITLWFWICFDNIGFCIFNEVVDESACEWLRPVVGNSQIVFVDGMALK